MITDPISEFLTAVRNAVGAKHKKVDVAASKMRIALAQILKEHGFISNFRMFRQEQKGILRIYLKYKSRGDSFLHGLSRVSRPSRRVYVGYDKIPPVQNGIGIAILSTSKGVITDQIAREQRLGGEILCKVW